MPSAEHAPAPQAGPPGPGAGSVIHLADRMRRRPAGPAPAPEPSQATSSPAAELAFTIQARFLHAGQSLNDPATADTFDITMQAVLLLVDGARAHDIVDQDQWMALRQMLDDMREAPEHI